MLHPAVAQAAISTTTKAGNPLRAAYRGAKTVVGESLPLRRLVIVVTLHGKSAKINRRGANQSGRLGRLGRLAMCLDVLMCLTRLAARDPLYESGLEAPVHQHIETTPDIAGGKPRIAGHRITVEDIVVWHEHQGKSTAQIADEFDLTLSEVHAALAYYRDHRPELDRAMELGRQYVDACRRASTSKVAEKRL